VERDVGLRLFFFFFFSVVMPLSRLGDGREGEGAFLPDEFHVCDGSPIGWREVCGKKETKKERELVRQYSDRPLVDDDDDLLSRLRNVIVPNDPARLTTPCT